MSETESLVLLHFVLERRVKPAKLILQILTLLLQNHSNARPNKTIVDFDFDERGRERGRGAERQRLAAVSKEK